jgi:hypothetical protein
MELVDPRVVRVKQVPLDRQVYKVFTVLRVRPEPVKQEQLVPQVSQEKKVKRVPLVLQTVTRVRQDQQARQVSQVRQASPLQERLVLLARLVVQLVRLEKLVRPVRLTDLPEKQE